VRAEDLAKTGSTESSPAAKASPATAGQNAVAIKPLRRTYVKVVVDNEAQQIFAEDSPTR